MSTVEITDVGPISKLTLPIPEAGGVVVIKGPNGVGKSTALEGVRSLVTKKNHGLSTRDDAPLGASGSIAWGEAKLTVGRRTSTTGELTCDHLEGKLDLAALVDPGMQTADTNDNRRIKALAALSGAEASKELFYPLVGEEAFKATVSSKAIAATDLVEMAALVKKDFETAARRFEDEATKATANADAAKAQIEGLDLEANCDAAELQAAFQAAIEAESTLKAQANAQAELAEKVKQARESLAKATASYEGPTLANAEADLKRAAEARDAAVSRMQVAQKALEDTRRQVEECDRYQTNAANELLHAKRHFNTLAEWEKTIEDAAATAPVAAESVEAAIAASEQARKAVENGARVRDAKLKAAVARSYAAEATKASEQAAKLRSAAKGVDGVLASAIKCDQFSIRDGRLIVKHEGRKGGEAFYDDLSDGERWRMAIDLAIDRLDREGVDRKEAVLTIPQGAYGELALSTKTAIHMHAIKSGVAILTAEADDGELRAVPFGLEAE